MIEKEAIETADYIIHLAGANIGDKRWSKQRRKLIIDSRVESANLLFDKNFGSAQKTESFYIGIGHWILWNDDLR